VALFAFRDSGSGSSGGTEAEDNSVEVDYSIVVSEACNDMGYGYSDIAAGAEVEVYDGSGALLGFGTLSSGKSGYSTCTFKSSFAADRSDDGVYRVTAGNSNRGFLNFREDELINDSLIVQATLG
jgi:hypothetical protein